MDWKLKFISQENFVKHVEATIDKYGEKLESFDIKRFMPVVPATWEAEVGGSLEPRSLRPA